MALGVPQEDAAVCVKIMLESDMRGIKSHGGTYAVGSYKHILKRRGVVDFAGCRPAGWPEMNDAAFRELDRIFELVQPMLRVKY